MGADLTNETEKRLRYSGVDQRKESILAWGTVGQVCMDESGVNERIIKYMSKCRVWVGRVAALAGDRNAEVRRAACQALHLVYTRMDGPTLLTHVAHASPADQVITSSLGAHLQPHSPSAFTCVPASLAFTPPLCFLCSVMRYVFPRSSCLLWQWNCTKAKFMLPSAMAQVVAGTFCWQHAKRSVTLCYHTATLLK